MIESKITNRTTQQNEDRLIHRKQANSSGVCVLGGQVCWGAGVLGGREIEQKKRNREFMDINSSVVVVG